jgi:uncharacterized membrane protein
MTRPNDDPSARRARRLLWLVVLGFLLFNLLAVLVTTR